jgi:hypothetical protein
MSIEGALGVYSGNWAVVLHFHWLFQARPVSHTKLAVPHELVERIGCNGQ